MAMGWDTARHLLGRASFGADPAQIDAMARRDLQRGVKALVKGARRSPVTAMPKWSMDPVPSADDRASMSRKERRKQQREWGFELRAWWYGELLATPSPLTERMTLFWHNHFTSSLQKVKWTPFVARQNALLRRHALGNFGDLLLAISQDPAMLLYLDNQSNHKREPNENFARELLELFTLGEGHYRERDIKAAARAFTGWRMRRRTGQFRFVKADHDDGEKVFLGQKGRWNGEDIVRILLAQERTAVHITEKMWRAFVSDVPDKAQVLKLARVFRSQKYAIGPLLTAMLTSDAFVARQNRGALIKSPVDLIVGTVRSLGVKVDDTSKLAQIGRRLGQDLLNPPNVKGWPGGPRWISTRTLLDRHEVLRGVAQRGLAQSGVTLESWTGAKGQGAIDRAVKTLLPLAPVSDIGGKRALGQILMDPTYQLK